jgi:hypothetical protein
MCSISALRHNIVEDAKWRAKISRDSQILAGKEIHLCNYHKINLCLKFDSIEELPHGA